MYAPFPDGHTGTARTNAGADARLRDVQADAGRNPDSALKPETHGRCLMLRGVTFASCTCITASLAVGVQTPDPGLIFPVETEHRSDQCLGSCPSVHSCQRAFPPWPPPYSWWISRGLPLNGSWQVLRFAAALAFSLPFSVGAAAFLPIGVTCPNILASTRSRAACPGPSGPDSGPVTVSGPPFCWEVRPLQHSRFRGSPCLLRA